MSTITNKSNISTTNDETTIFRRINIYKVSSVAALTAGALFLISAIDLILTVLHLDSKMNGLSLFQNNWLIVIFKLHAGFSGITLDQLHILNVLDIVILAIVGTMFLGLYSALRKTSKIWSIIAALQPFLGMVLFIMTKNAGRSGVMGAALVISFVMLQSDTFNKFTAYLGILASTLLLVGDFSAGVISPLAILATLVGIGYVSLVAWFFLVARQLFQLGESEGKDTK